MEPHFDPRRRIRLTMQGSLQWRGGLVEVCICNLSLGGAMIAHQDRLVPGRSCVLRLALPGRDLDVPAQVIWSKASGAPSGPREDVRFVSGLRFLALAERIEIRLREYLVTLAKSPLSVDPE